jgi:hypothetical protein
MLIYLLLFGTALVKPRTQKKDALLADYTVHDNEPMSVDQINDPITTAESIRHASFSSQKSNSSNTGRQLARYAESYSARTVNLAASNSTMINPITGEADMPPTRGKSISDYLSKSARSLSVSLRVQNEGANEIDEFTLVRTMSVT